MSKNDPRGLWMSYYPLHYFQYLEKYSFVITSYDVFPFLSKTKLLEIFLVFCNIPESPLQLLAFHT